MLRNPDEELSYSYYKPKSKPTPIIESQNEDDSDEEADQNEEKVSCEICYLDHPKSKTFALVCGHTFGKSCLRQMFKISIENGNVVDNKCAHFTCKLKYSEKDIKQIVTDQKILDKYAKFKANICKFLTENH